MSEEDALESHGFEIRLEDQISRSGPRKKKPKVMVEDAADYAARGEFLEPPAVFYTCK